MGYRLSKVATRTGDGGQTALGNGMRVDKNNPVIEVLGAVDELNSWIGVVSTLARSDRTKEAMHFVQHDLFDLGAQVSVPGTPLLSERHLARIDELFEDFNGRVGKLKEFILPGGHQSAAFAHVARTVCRRAERRLFTLIECNRTVSQAPGSQLPESDHVFGLSYLNRLSDLLFVVSRLENYDAGQLDVYWERGQSLRSSAI